MLFFCCLSAFAPACRQSAPAPDAGDASANVAVVANYLQDAFGNRLDKVRGYLSPGLRFYGPARKDTLDAQGLIESWQNLHARYDSADYKNLLYSSGTVTNKPAGADWVDVWFDARFHRADLGKWSECRVHLSCYLKNRQIDSIFIYVNQWDILSQFGYSMQPPDTAGRPDAGQNQPPD